MSDDVKSRCMESQIDEIEALRSIYGDNLKVDSDSSSHLIEINENKKNVVLYFTLPEKYPFEEPPVYTLSAPSLTKEEKFTLNTFLESVYLSNIGNNVIYQWVETIRDFLIENYKAETISTEPELMSCIDKPEVPLPEIMHGDVITDRKSVFQPHLAKVTTVHDIERVLDCLKENKKIANATHNMYAYRIAQTNSNYFIQDCEDDGETQAGARMLHLLQILNASNVMVIVTRWYGGVHLGADRFRHINNAVRQILEKAGFIANSKK